MLSAKSYNNFHVNIRQHWSDKLIDFLYLLLKVVISKENICCLFMSEVKQHYPKR